MRISGGIWRGRPIAVPGGDGVRPTQDRVREALFSMLNGCVEGASFLDLFAGSGAVGLDALSHGARCATFVEAAPRHATCLEANVAKLLGGDAARAEIVRADAYAWLESAGRGRHFDLAFADPPYAVGAEVGYAKVLETLAVNDVVRGNGLFVAEMTYRQDPDANRHWDLCRDRVYGQTRIAVYRRKSEIAE